MKVTIQRIDGNIGRARVAAEVGIPTSNTRHVENETKLNANF
jgi:hypothetical protein